jgi:hypothetical protein
MATHTGHFTIALLLGAGALIAHIETADAGQPWSCQCNGVTKRFIASTRACERSQPKNKSVRLMRDLTRCTRAEFITWNRNACISEGCTLPR